MNYMVNESALKPIVLYAATLEWDCVSHYFQYADNAYHYIIDSLQYKEFADEDEKDKFYEDGIDLAAGRINFCGISGVGYIELIEPED